MRIINTKISFILMLFMLALSACFEERDHSYTDQWVAFDRATLSRTESTPGDLSVKLLYAGKLKDSDIVVNYTVTSPDGVEGEDFELAGTGSVTIPAGQTTVTFPVLSTIDNDFQQPNRTVVITLESASDLPVGFPGPAGNHKSLTVTIVDDDCAPEIPKIAKWLGALTAEDEGFATYDATGLTGDDGVCGGELVVQGDILGFGEDSKIKIAFTQSSPGSTSGDAVVARDIFFTDPGLSGYEYEAVGTYDEETQTIVIEYNFYKPDGSLWFPGVHIIKHD